MIDEDEESLFGRVEAAVLLAVEYANGGEWADLGQVLAGFDSIFDRLPEAGELTDAFGLLCEAGLIDYRAGGLELTPQGRKLLRHSGMPGAPRRPTKILEQLQKIADAQLAEEGSVPQPEQSEVAAVLKNLDSAEGQAFVGYMGAKHDPPFTATLPLVYGITQTPHFAIDDQHGGGHGALPMVSYGAHGTDDGEDGAEAEADDAYNAYDSPDGEVGEDGEHGEGQDD